MARRKKTSNEHFVRMTKRVHGRCKLYIPMKSNKMSVVSTTTKKKKPATIETQT